MFPRRVLVALALACAASLALASVASAATTAKLNIKLSSSKAGTSKKPKAVKLNFDLAVDTDDGTSPPTTKETVVSFSKGIKFNSNIFPSCTLATLNSKGPSGCVKGSKVGTGSALALVGGSPGEPKPSTTEALKVTAFNGPQGKSLLLYLDGDSPAAIKQAISGTLKKASSPFGYRARRHDPAEPAAASSRALRAARQLQGQRRRDPEEEEGQEDGQDQLHRDDLLPVRRRRQGLAVQGRPHVRERSRHRVGRDASRPAAEPRPGQHSDVTRGPAPAGPLAFTRDFSASLVLRFRSGG